MSFLGEHEVTLDKKGRFSIPVGFRKQLPEGDEVRGFVVSRGFGQYLSLYTRSEWELYAAKIEKLNDFNPKAQKLKRILLSGATELLMDTAGRVLIPKSLLEYAGLEKDVIFTTVSNKVELWDSKRYNEYIMTESGSVEALGLELLGGEALDPFDTLS